MNRVASNLGPWGALVFGLIAALSTPHAQAQLPVAFDPCVPAGSDGSGLDFARLCPSDIQGPGIVVRGASADTHRELLSLLQFGSVTDVSSERIQQIGIALSETDRYDDISILPAGNLIDVTLLEKPRLAALVFNNNTLFSDGELARLANLEIGVRFDRDEVVQKGRDILQAYQDRSYFDAAIVPSADRTSSFTYPVGVSVVFTLEEGEVAKVSEIRFKGNTKVSDKTLAAAISARAGMPASALSKQLIADDQAAIANAYADTGFERTSVSAQIQTVGADGQLASETNPPKSVVLVFNIEEREGYRVGDVEVEDQSGGAGGDVQPKSQPGEEFDPEKTQENAQELAEELNEDSDKDLGVRTEITVNEDTGEINVTYVVFEVPPRELIAVTYEGNEQTAEAYLNSVFAIPLGTKVSRKDLRDGAQRIANTGLFTSVSIEEQSAPAGKVAIKIILEEAKTGTQRLGASLSSLYGFSISGGIEERNWLGYGLFAGVAFELSEDRQLLRAFYQDTNYRQTGQTLSASAQASRAYSDTADYATYSIGASAALSQKIDEFSTRTTSVALNVSRIEEVGPGATSLAASQEGETEYSIDLGYAYDYTNIEGELAPIGGEVSNARANLALSSTVDPTLTLGVSGTKYWALDEGKRTVFSARGSLDQVFNLTGDDVPLQGRLIDPTVKVRGFSAGGIAPRESNGSTVGGTTAIGGSLQLRYQLTQSENFPLFGAVFLDAGMVFDAGDMFNLDNAGTLLTISDSDALRLSAGISLSLVTGGGAISLSYSEPLASESFDKTQKFQFSLGTNF